VPALAHNRWGQAGCTERIGCEGRRPLQPRTDRGNEDRVDAFAATDWALVSTRVLALR
jgi:hypothetical protein